MLHIHIHTYRPYEPALAAEATDLPPLRAGDKRNHMAS